MLKEVGMTKDAPVKAVPGVDPEEAVDAAVVKEKQSVFDHFDDTGGVCGRTSDDADQEERAEV
jgi:hypothetical protein